MIEKSLGERIRELRDAADYSLREFARTLEISAPHLSDIELGRRYPSDEVLQRIASQLGVSFAELKRYDVRESVAEVKKLVDSNPMYGFAFRSVAKEAREGRLSPAELLRRLTRSEDEL